MRSLRSTSARMSGIQTAEVQANVPVECDTSLSQLLRGGDFVLLLSRRELKLVQRAPKRRQLVAARRATATRLRVGWRTLERSF
jgi:hypothetical protein